MKKLLFSLILFAGLAVAQRGFSLSGTLSADAVTNLNAWATTQVQMAGAATATAAIGAGDTTITVANCTNVAAGVTVLIDAEAVSTSTCSGNTLTVAASGRGYFATAAAAHLSGVQIAVLKYASLTAVGKAVLLQAVQNIAHQMMLGNYATYKAQAATTQTNQAASDAVLVQ